MILDIPRQFIAALESQTLQDLTDVILDRVLADAEFQANFLVAPPLGQMRVPSPGAERTSRLPPAISARSRIMERPKCCVICLFQNCQDSQG